MTRKLIIHDGKSERELLLVGTLTVGRDPSCHINDLDPLLSRRHAEFVTTKSGCTVRDLGSRNGMLVNGMKVREQLLKVGDLVQLGHLQMRYAEDQAAATPDVVIRSNATTAAAPSVLEDTRPHPPQTTPDDDLDATRLPSAKALDDEATMAPRGRVADADADATVAPVGKKAPAVDLDATVAPGSRQADPDATFMVSTRPAASSAPVAPVSSDFDATGVGRTSVVVAAALTGTDFDQTIAPGSLDLDATFVTSAPSSAARPGAMPPMEARLTAGADLRITGATAGCRAHFNVAPDTLVGRPLGDVLAERLASVVADGPAELTLSVDRAPGDRSLIVILKTAQVETVS